MPRVVLMSRILTSATIAILIATSATAGHSARTRMAATNYPALRAVLERTGGLVDLSAPNDEHGHEDRATPILNNFRLLGHHDLGQSDANGDVWVHGDYAYVGTWSIPCTGGGAKIIDVSDLNHPQLIGRLGARAGTSAEDIVVRHVHTHAFRGELLAVGIQRCGGDPALNSQQFGLQLWDVSDPRNPTRLSELGMSAGGGGVHELDLMTRGDKVFALVATPNSEWFDPLQRPEFRIVEVTDPRAPQVVGGWTAGAAGLSPGPFYGRGSFGSRYAHSVRASEDGRRAYVSYWDLGVLTFDISDVTNPQLLTRTRYGRYADGDAHSVAEYSDGHRNFLLQNDEDFDPNGLIDVRVGKLGGVGALYFGGPPIYTLPDQRLEGKVVVATNEGCDAADYPAETAGKIAVVRTPFPFFDPAGGAPPQCQQSEQAAAAAAAGARALIYDFIAEATSPQGFDFAPITIPGVFVDHSTAEHIVSAGEVTLIGRRPSWGFLRVMDAHSGAQLTTFDELDHVHELPAPPGSWSIHNTEVLGDRAYVSWYGHGIVALDLKPLKLNRAPRLVGQFVPTGVAEPVSPIEEPNVASVWGVAVREDGVIFASDINSGLWIIKPKGRAR